MAPIHVLIVDDSSVFQRLIPRVLRTEASIGRIEVVASGPAALEALARERPDVVVLDVVMPGMDGLAVLREIRRRDASLPVVMFSGSTGHAAKATIEALLLGASDCVEKNATSAIGAISALIPRIKALAQAPGERRSAQAPQSQSQSQSQPRQRPADPLARLQALIPRRPDRVQLIAIGSSTGGPQALEQVLSQLPGSLPVPVVVVQHLPAGFSAQLAHQLDGRCALRVREGVSGARLAAGDVWIAPGGRHMSICGDRLLMTDAAPENSCRPAVDVLFRSAAKGYGRGVLAAVLTGMGSDGARGAAEIVAAGGRVLAQDRRSSIVWGMPRAVVEAGLADEVMPLAQIAGVLERRSRAVARRGA